MKKLVLVTYDLKQPGRSYSELYDRIKSIAGEGNWQHPLDSTWVIMIPDDIELDDLTKRLKDVMDSKDGVFVVDITEMPCQGWLPRSFWEWLDK